MALQAAHIRFVPVSKVDCPSEHLVGFAKGCAQKCMMGLHRWFCRSLFFFFNFFKKKNTCFVTTVDFEAKHTPRRKAHKRYMSTWVWQYRHRKLGGWASVGVLARIRYATMLYAFDRHLQMQQNSWHLYYTYSEGDAWTSYLVCVLLANGRENDQGFL